MESGKHLQSQVIDDFFCTINISQPEPKAVKKKDIVKTP